MFFYKLFVFIFLYFFFRFHDIFIAAKVNSFVVCLLIFFFILYFSAKNLNYHLFFHIHNYNIHHSLSQKPNLISNSLSAFSFFITWNVNWVVFLHVESLNSTQNIKYVLFFVFKLWSFNLILMDGLGVRMTAIIDRCSQFHFGSKVKKD